MTVLDRIEQASGIDAHLSSWARWMRQDSGRLGYPRHVPGIASGYVSQSFEDMCDAVDDRVDRIVDACIRDLVSAQCCAVHSVWLGSRWVIGEITGQDLQDCYAGALETLTRRLPMKGVIL